MALQGHSYYDPLVKYYSTIIISSRACSGQRIPQIKTLAPPQLSGATAQANQYLGCHQIEGITTLLRTQMVMFSKEPTSFAIGPRQETFTQKENTQV